MKLYKYIKNEHRDLMINQGVFRIGTLLDFRDSAKYGTEIGEIDEGSITLDFDAWEGRELELSSETYEAALIRHCLNISPDDPWLKNRLVFGKGTKFEANLQSTNGYLFCTTTDFNKDVMKSFGCDSCIEIHNPEKFIETLSKSVSNKLRFVREGKVTYTERQQNYRGLKDFHPAMIKPVDYLHQAEHRIVWEPITTENIAPFFVTCPEAICYCRNYDF